MVASKNVKRGAIAVAGATAAIGASCAARIALRTIGRYLAMARFGLRVVTLRANRRCPDCKTKIRRDARVCGSCGFRLRDEPSKKKQQK